MTLLLQAKELAIGHGSRCLGRGLELSLRSGQVVALLGPNGSGKTTLLRTLLGLQPALAGSVVLAGRELTRYGERERARYLAYVPQASGNSFAFSVLELVLMGRVARLGLLSAPGKQEVNKARDVLQQLGIGNLADKLWPQLSGGQQQLVLLARALLQEPRVLLLDEPTASLDFANQILVLEQLATLRRAGLAILFTTHQPEHAQQLADRVLLFKEGCIRQEGGPELLLDAEVLAWLYDVRAEQVTRHWAGRTGVSQAAEAGSN